MSSIYAVHQPNFLPWTGFFNKIVSSDFFVLLDDVQISKTGGSWVNRHKLMGKNEVSVWMTIPIKRGYSGAKLIKDVEISENIEWREDYLRRVRQLYHKTDHLSEGMKILEKLFSRANSIKLAENNITLIFGVLEEMDLKSDHIILSSSLEVKGKKTERLVEYGKIVNAEIYLTGTGSKDYLKPIEFEENGMKVIYQHNFIDEFVSTSMSNENSFSIVHFMLKYGLNDTRKYILDWSS